MQSSTHVEIYSNPAFGHQSPAGMNDGSSYEVEERNQQRRTRWTRAAIGLVLAISLLFVIVDASFGDRKVEAAISNFLEWVQEHPFEGVLAVICVYIVATILFVPGSILTLGTGYAFGRAFDSTAFGVLLASTVSTISPLVSVLGRIISTFSLNQAVFIGACLGSICSFILGRYLFRDCVLRLAASYPIFRAIDGGELFYT
jgi:uncharacterized membrane protein YdjX (TVP38/TMEM64 family)